MNNVIKDLHHKRYEWALHAKKEFLDQFVRLDVEKVHLLHPVQEKNRSSDYLWPFLSLTNCFKLVESERQQENEKNKKDLEKLEQMISEKKTLLNEKLNFFHMKNHEFSSKIEKYHELLADIEAVLQEMKNVDREYVKYFLNYDVKQKKASILNQQAIKLQITMEKKLENQLTGIIERADRFHLVQDSHLRLPKLEPIPKIHQKMDSYWLKSRYDRAYNHLFDNAMKWVEQMYMAYSEVLAPVLNEAFMQRNQLLNEAEALQLEKEENITNIQIDLSAMEAKREILCEKHSHVNRLWEQDYQHAKQLQRYFMKHWLLYKKKLQQQLLTDNPEECWAAFQYLQLLQQDGENIIETINI